MNFVLMDDGVTIEMTLAPSNKIRCKLGLLDALDLKRKRRQDQKQNGTNETSPQESKRQSQKAVNPLQVNKLAKNYEPKKRGRLLPEASKQK